MDSDRIRFWERVAEVHSIKKPVARELAPAGSRSGPSTKSEGLLRSPAGRCDDSTSSLATVLRAVKTAKHCASHPPDTASLSGHSPTTRDNAPPASALQNSIDAFCVRCSGRERCRAFRRCLVFLPWTMSFSDTSKNCLITTSPCPLQQRLCPAGRTGHAHRIEI